LDIKNSLTKVKEKVSEATKNTGEIVGNFQDTSKKKIKESIQKGKDYYNECFAHRERNENEEIVIPNPIIDKKEERLVEALNKRYEKLAKQGFINKTTKAIGDKIPQKLKDGVKDVTSKITEQELYEQCMKVVSEGFGKLQEIAAKHTISEDMIINKINSLNKENNIYSLDEICLTRAYDIVKSLENVKSTSYASALIEGGTTGAAGFWGIPFSIVLSTFLFFRTVEEIAMHYGYDVKNDPAELQIVAEVFMKAFNPSETIDVSESGTLIMKIMAISEISAVKDCAKSWSKMAASGSLCLWITQVRALANKQAQKALAEAGKDGLENSVFRSVFNQLGKSFTQANVKKAVPVFGAIVGAAFDTYQMSKIIEYADVFYCKRFLCEKAANIDLLFNEKDVVIIQEIENDNDKL